MIWVSLHTHSTFSFGDGYGTVDEHVNRVAELGMSSVALTEHGNTSSHVQLEQACRRHNINAIFGLEAYIAEVGERRKFHSILIAQTEEGYRNLNRIVTYSWIDNFYQFPTVTFDCLEEYNDGIIVLSGCADSELSCTLLGGKSFGDRRMEYSSDDFQSAIGLVSRYKKVFGSRYFIEVQRFNRLERTCILNPAFEKLSIETGVPLAATADVHYPKPQDNEMQRILHASHRGGTVETADADWEYDILLTYPESDVEIYRDLKATGLSSSAAKSAVENTALIAEMCNG